MLHFSIIEKSDVAIEGYENYSENKEVTNGMAIFIASRTEVSLQHVKKDLCRLTN